VALVVIVCLQGGLLAGLVLYAKLSAGLPKLPSVEDYRPPVLSELWSDDRVLTGELYDERRKVVSYERIPKKLIQAFVAAEDERFFDHPGFDPIGTARAAFRTFVQRRKVQGGSSLTQQAAKAILVSLELGKISDEEVRAEALRRVGSRPADEEPDKYDRRLEAARYRVRAERLAQAHARATEKKLGRKIRELILALRLEKALSKEQILYLYLNNVYLGHHSYGVQSAAENYFRKDVRHLTSGEIALLAGLPQAPTKYSPFVHPEAAKKRREYVLRRMAEEGMIGAAERRLAEEEEVKVFPVEDVFHEMAPFFAEHARRDIVNRYGNERLLKDGLKVFLTMNSERQRAAQLAMLDGLIRVDKRQGFSGALAHLASETDRAAFRRRIAEKLGDERITPGRFYVGFVQRVDNEANLAEIDMGGEVAKLPLAGMRWAREPNPERYYPSALIDHVKRALKVGDVVVVKAVQRSELFGEDGRANERVPQEGTFVTLEQEPTLQGALVSEDPGRRYLVAMIGGYDFDASEFNRAFQACRQPGSSFKPVIYSAALEQLGWAVNHVLVDAPVVFDDPQNQLRWKPENFGEEFKGDVLLRSAVINSMNVPAVKTLYEVGVKEAAAWAHRLGISTLIHEDLSMALGGSCVHLNELVNVYAGFDLGGQKLQPSFVRKVEDRFGRTLEDHTAYDDEFATFEERVAAGYARLFDKPDQVMKPETAFLMTHLMREVVLYGTGAAAKALGKPAAGKTGTTNDSYDTWFMGFTKDLATGVWLGYDRSEHPLGKYETGGRAALPIWVDYMKSALSERPQPELSESGNLDIAWARIDSATGKLAGPDSRNAVKAPFVRGTEPVETELGPGQIDARETLLRDTP
jgi:penicillin-binding protein 1A